MSTDHFVEAYRGTPPWDIGRHQPAFEPLADAGEIARAGARRRLRHRRERPVPGGAGLRGVGVDAVRGGRRGRAPQGRRARPARPSSSSTTPSPSSGLGRRFATVIDSGLFHTFDDDERERFATSLARPLEPGGRYFVLCFSEREKRGRRPAPRDAGGAAARPSTGRRSACSSIEAAEMATNLEDSAAQAWLARVERRRR